MVAAASKGLDTLQTKLPYTAGIAEQEPLIRECLMPLTSQPLIHGGSQMAFAYAPTYRPIHNMFCTYDWVRPADEEFIAGSGILSRARTR